MLNRTTPPEPRKTEGALNINAENLALLVKSLALNIQTPKSAEPQRFLMALSDNKIEINWQQFGVYLSANFNAKTNIDRITYARKYSDLLLNRDLTPLQAMTPDKRQHVMKALTALSKHLGCYEDWLDLKKQHGIKWGNPNAALLAFEKISNEENGHIDDMQAWINNATARLLPKYANAIIYNLHCGLRPHESIESMKLLSQEPTIYHRNGLLYHFKYPQLFLRRTKKAFISIATKRMLEIAQDYQRIDYNGMRSALQRLGLGCHVEYCRQIYATRLKQAGIETEMIDLLQGRLPQNVFLRHYYRPNFKKECERIKSIIEQPLN